MKRWFIARLGDYEGDGSLVPKVMTHFTTTGAEINVRIWSKPGFGWCFGQLATDTLTSMQSDPDIVLIPDASLDIVWSTVPKAKRDEIKLKLESAGFSYAGITTNSTIRQILQKLKGQLQADTDVESGDVRDVGS